MKKIAVAFLVAFCFLMLAHGAGLAKLILTEKILRVEEISGKIDLFGEAEGDDFSEDMVVEGHPVLVFFKVVRTGILRKDIRDIKIFVIRKNLEGKCEKGILSNDEFFIMPDGTIVFPIGLTINNEPCELLVGGFIIRISR